MRVQLSWRSDDAAAQGRRQNAVGGHDSSHAAPRAPLSGELLETQTFEGEPTRISRDELNAVMSARLDQLFGLIGDEIRRSGYDGMLPAGVVLTGGVASMPGIAQAAQRKLRTPVRVGKPRKVGGLTDAFDSPMYATGVGLIMWGAKESASTLTTPGAAFPTRHSNIASERESLLAKWLKMFLPHG